MGAWLLSADWDSSASLLQPACKPGGALLAVALAPRCPNAACKAQLAEALGWEWHVLRFALWGNGTGQMLCMYGPMFCRRIPQCIGMVKGP